MSLPPTSGSMPSLVSPGTRFGNYEILQRIGAGGMGEVYRAKDLRLGREVAIKTILQNRCSQGTDVSRFQQEARTASKLNHPNIVTIYELGDVDGALYIAMELVRGETIRNLLAAGPIPIRKTIEIAVQVAGALAKAHENGVIHRDLKPDNLIVSADGEVKILDFGLSKLFSVSDGQSSDALTSAGSLTESGTLVGTVGYMSPEQVAGGVADFRSDQFSFGLVFYEMATGRPAFAAKSPAEHMAAVLRDEAPRYDSKTVQGPAPFFWVLERCLAKDPKNRYASTRDLARDLATIRDRLAESPARHTECRCNNLPVSRTAMVGRERESTALRQILGRENVRLVTLTGPGGIGKTRLALQVAAQGVDQFPEGVCFVSMSAVSERAMIASVIAQSMGLHETGNQTLQDALAERVGSLASPMLLLLDNFEHLVSAAPIIADLLTLSSKLKIVVTSQIPLHIYGEHEFPVPPLAIPDLKTVPPVDVLSGFPAIALFVDRVHAVKPEFELKKENAAAVAGICSRLDGLPLAIELAAARMKLLSPSAMLARLESCLTLLTGGARDLPVRQQTLRATVDWSYSLLNAAEQMLFRRLSVFAGGCTLDGVEAVCDTKGDLGLDVLDGMASLLDKSLVQQVEAGTESRFRMLSTIREYAFERLRESANENAARRAHAAYYLVLAEEGAEELAANPEWLDRIEIEHDNLRQAHDYLIDTANADWALRLSAALFPFWETREYLSEGRDGISRALQLEGAGTPSKLRARVLFDAGVLAAEQGDYASARQRFQESLDNCVELHDDYGIGVALNALGITASDQGELSEARSFFERCAEKWKEMGNSADVARTLSNLANIARLQGDCEHASSLYDECLAIFQSLRNDCNVAWTLNYQGDLARETGDFVAARTLYEKGLAEFGRLKEGWGIASTQCDLGSLWRDQGNYSEANKFYRESITTFQDLGHKRGIAKVLESLAASAAAQVKYECSLRLAGTAAALRQRLGAPLSRPEQWKLEKILETPRERLGNAASLTAWLEGWGMTIDEAVGEAFSSSC